MADRAKDINEVFRHQSIISTRILAPTDKLPELCFKFTSEEDPCTKSPISLEFGFQDFKEVTGEAAEDLFKFAALRKIEESSEKAKLSVKYQVLVKETAMVGVIKSIV